MYIWNKIDINIIYVIYAHGIFFVWYIYNLYPFWLYRIPIQTWTYKNYTYNKIFECILYKKDIFGPADVRHTHTHMDKFMC